MLCTLGVDINAELFPDSTPLHLAVTVGFSKGVHALLSAGCDVNEVNSVSGDSLLHVAVQKQRYSSKKLYGYYTSSYFKEG